jgi:uncharacterized protein YecE (DUF72 family)
MQFFVGTSGYAYREWKGRFYPEKLPAKEMLSYYARHFPAVEINASFKRIPSPDTLKSWMSQVPASFQFGLKAPEVITHRRRLKDCREEVRQFLGAAAVLKQRRGPLLFQLPPNFKKDLPRLKDFLKLLGNSARAAIEFRHASWFDAEVFDALRKHRCALCVADAEELPVTDLVATAGWGYVRLRREKYARKDLKNWIERMKSQPWTEVYVFFKHEDTGSGPKLGEQFMALTARSSPS